MTPVVSIGDLVPLRDQTTELRRQQIYRIIGAANNAIANSSARMNRSQTCVRIHSALASAMTAFVVAVHNRRRLDCLVSAIESLTGALLNTLAEDVQ